VYRTRSIQRQDRETLDAAAIRSRVIQRTFGSPWVLLTAMAAIVMVV